MSRRLRWPQIGQEFMRVWDDRPFRVVSVGVKYAVLDPLDVPLSKRRPTVWTPEGLRNYFVEQATTNEEGRADG